MSNKSTIRANAAKDEITSYKYSIGSMDIEMNYNSQHLLHSINTSTPAIIGSSRATGLRWVEYFRDGEMVNGPQDYHRAVTNADGAIIEMARVAWKGKNIYVQVLDSFGVHYHRVHRDTGGVYISSENAFVRAELAPR